MFRQDYLFKVLYFQVVYPNGTFFCRLFKASAVLITTAFLSVFFLMVKGMTYFMFIFNANEKEFTKWEIDTFKFALHFIISLVTTSFFHNIFFAFFQTGWLCV